MPTHTDGQVPPPSMIHFRPKPMKIYIAGKISNLPPCEVKDKFNSAKQRLKNLGFEPISPLDNGCDSTLWHEQMMACLPMLIGCNGIYLLKDWSDSEGAKIEMMFACKMGMLVIEEIKQP